MNLAELSIRRPIFIICIVILMLAVGLISLKKLPVDLFPDVTFPIVSIVIAYPGAGPEEVETLITRPVEEEIGTLSGLKTLTSESKEGFTRIIAKFTLETDIKDAEQRVRDRVSFSRRKLPDEIEEPLIRRIDPADQPVTIVALAGDLPLGQLYDLANEDIKPKLEQVSQVGLVELMGGRRREIHVDLDRAKLKRHELSADQVVRRISQAGQNIPAGTVEKSDKETVVRTVAEFKSIDDVKSTIVNFVGNDIPVTIADLGEVKDSLKDEKSRTSYNGKPSLFLSIYRQSGANTISVVDSVAARVDQLQAELSKRKDFASANLSLKVVRDGAKYIRANVFDVQESIVIGILLTILVVFFFLGSGRSTIITGMALPNSLIGAFILMHMAGFSINVMSLLALSLTVGLLIDDAIVVRENIFRHLELGFSPKRAALLGTNEVTLAVIATTATVIAVFGPIGFLDGVVGQFFKQFGLTICFAMMISLFDALTVAPMMSAYLASKHSEAKGLWYYSVGYLLRGFDRFQTFLENVYGKTLGFTLKFPVVILAAAAAIFVASVFALQGVPKTFLPPQDNGEFAIDLDMPPGTSLEKMSEVALAVDEKLRARPEVVDSIMTIGNSDGEANVATFFVTLVGRHERKMNTSEFKELMRGELKSFSYANPVVKDIDMVSGGLRPFNLNISGTNLQEIESIAKEIFAKLKDHPALKDPDISFRPGKPEFQAKVDKNRAAQLGVSTDLIGSELRTHLEGATPAVFREAGREYDIRVRLQEDQRDLKSGFSSTYVPNINNTLVRLGAVASPVETTGPSNILRQDRGRYIQISADIAPDGPGMGGVINDINKMFKEDVKLPPGVTYSFVGQAEDFKDLMQNMLAAAGLGILFIYLVLASLYESFITPFTIMLVLPLAACGAFFGLALTGKSFDLFSMIGCVMLLGIATKNSILLVDYTNHLMDQGVERAKAIIQAGRTRLRPILMTSFALIAGMLPVAIGLNEASAQRTSMGVAVIGGLISSTLLTLLVIPAAFVYIDSFRKWISRWIIRLSGYQPEEDELNKPLGDDSISKEPISLAQ